MFLFNKPNILFCFSAINHYLTFPISVLIYMRSNLGLPSILQFGLPGTAHFPQQAVDFMWLIGGYSNFKE